MFIIGGPIVFHTCFPTVPWLSTGGVLHEGHRENVPVSITRSHHPVSGHTLPNHS